MSFFWPSMLSLLLLVPLLAAGYFLLQRRRKKTIEVFGSPGWPQLGRRRHVPALFFLLALTGLILSLARPKASVNLPRVEGTAMLVFDVSGSMAADDFKPTRMEAAKSAALAFVERQPPGVLVGVVAFSDGGLEVLPPTDDHEALQNVITRLAPQRGTSLAGGIFAALDSLAAEEDGPADPLTPMPSPTPLPRGQYAPAVIVLLTDGENNMSPDPLEAAQAALERGVRIHSIGIGSPQGVTLTINDFVVHTSLDEQTLKDVSALTGGAYFNAQTEADFQKIYDSVELQLVVRSEDMEVTSLFAGFSILLLLAGGLFSMLWFNRVP